MLVVYGSLRYGTNLLPLMMELKISQFKNEFNTLSVQNTIAYLNWAQNTYMNEPTLERNNLIQSLFYNKLLNISCNLLHSILKNEEQNGCKCTGCSPS